MRPETPPSTVSRWRWVAGVVALALLWFGALGVRGLFAPDEGRYALIPHEMLAYGDWITPHLNRLVYLEKPPLQYWATAALFALFGEHEWTVRLWPALTGFATLGIAGAFARSLRGPREAAVTVCILASSLLFFLFSQVTTLDMGLTFFLTAGLLAFIQAMRDTTHARRWAAGGWFALALGFLSKGLIALVLPALTAAVYAAVARNLTFLRRLHVLLGGLIFIVVAGPWLALAQIQHHEFFSFFIVHEHFARYSTEVHHRTGAWWYFIAVTAAGVLPWTAFGAGLPRSAVLARPSRDRVGEAAILGLWSAVVVLFFSFSDSKLPAYVLPALPALAILLACAVCDAAPVRAARCAWLAAAMGVLLGAAAVVLASRGVDDVPAGAATGYLPWAGATACLLVAGAWQASRLFRRARPVAASIVLGAAAVSGWQSALTGSVTFEQAYSGRAFARTVLDDLGRHAGDGEWYSVGTFDNSFAYYAGHPLTVVAYEDELKLGLSIDPRRGVPTLNAFIERWRSARQAFAMMQPASYAELQGRGVPMKLVARDLRRVFVARAPLDDPQ